MEGLEPIISLAKQKGFIYQGSEIYGGLAGTWDYGPLGVELKNNIKNSWWKYFVQSRADMYGVDAAILMNSQVWEASGHVEEFHDPLVEDVVTKKRYRADSLLEEQGVKDADSLTLEQMSAKIKELDLKSPEDNELGEVQQFNMMFKTHIGASASSATESYLRPETAQGIFTNFKNILDSFHPTLPFGIGQIGKAFRNEITPQDFIFRVREFEMMEIEYFIEEKQWKASFKTWLDEMKKWVESTGIDMKKISEREHPQEGLSHYSLRTVDLEFDFPFGTEELTGLAYRTDFDLSAHQKHSGAKLEYRDEATGETFIPHVIEPTFGVDRLVLALLVSVHREEKLEDGDSRTVLGFTTEMAPIKIAVLPLMKKDGLAEKAREIFTEFSGMYVCQYDQTGSIGKRYRRQDEIGTPFCITVDYDTLEDGTVTLRERDSMEQKRVSKEELSVFLKENL